MYNLDGSHMDVRKDVKCSNYRDVSATSDFVVLRYRIISRLLYCIVDFHYDTFTYRPSPCVLETLRCDLS